MKRMLISQLMTLMIICGMEEGCAQAPVSAGKLADTRSFAVFALSRGAGVPAPTRAALNDVQDLLEQAQKDGVKVEVSKARIGIEGETRLCAQFAEREAAEQMLERIRNLVKGIDLIDLVIEPCSGQ